MAIDTKLRVQPDDHIRWVYTSGATPDQLAKEFDMDIDEINRILSLSYWPGRPLAELIYEDAKHLIQIGAIPEIRWLYQDRTCLQEVADGYRVSIRAIWWAADTPNWDDPTSSDNWDEVLAWYNQ